MSISSLSTYTPTPKYWEKSSKDVSSDTWGNARDIGYIRKDYSRISIISSLSTNDDDSKDWYKFLVQTKGPLSMSIQTDAEGSEELNPASENYYQDIIDYYSGKGLKIELYNKDARGNLKVVATNDKENAEGFANFEKLIRGEMEVNPGQMYVKVSTTDGKVPKQDVNYVLQFQMGTSYQHDYATIEQAQNLTAVEKYQATLDNPYSMYSEEVQGLLDSVTTNSLILQGQAAATLLESGASNMNSILSANKLRAQGKSTIFNFLS